MMLTARFFFFVLRQLDVALGVAAGLMHLHAEGIVHRDLAARNILLDVKNGLSHTRRKCALEVTCHLCFYSNVDGVDYGLWHESRWSG